MSLDTLTKYPVKDSSKAVYHVSDRAIKFGNHLIIGVCDPINDYNGSLCKV